MQHEQENAVMQHEQENATFNKATCKIDAIGNLIRPNSLLLNDQTFTRYAECLGMKINKIQEKFFIHRVMGLMFKKDFHFKPNLILHIELHTTVPNVTREHVESALKREIQSTSSAKCNKIFLVNRQECKFYA